MRFFNYDEEIKKLRQEIRNLESQINQLLPLLAQKKDVESELIRFSEAMQVHMRKEIMSVSSEAARSLVQNVRSGNESINFIQEIVTRIKALQLNLVPADWEVHGKNGDQ